MIPERYLNFLSEISGKFPIGNFGKLPRPIPIWLIYLYFVWLRIEIICCMRDKGLRGLRILSLKLKRLPYLCLLRVTIATLFLTNILQ